jgi:hypothetical protein
MKIIILKLFPNYAETFSPDTLREPLISRHIKEIIYAIGIYVNFLQIYHIN